MIRASETVEKLASDLRAVGAELYAKDVYGYFLAGDSYNADPEPDLIAVAPTPSIAVAAQRIIAVSGVRAVLVSDIRSTTSPAIRSILPSCGKYEVICVSRYDLTAVKIPVMVDGLLLSVDAAMQDTFENFKKVCENSFPTGKTFKLIDGYNKRVLRECSVGTVYTVRRACNYEPGMFAKVLVPRGGELTYEMADDALSKNPKSTRDPFYPDTIYYALGECTAAVAVDRELPQPAWYVCWDRFTGTATVLRQITQPTYGQAEAALLGDPNARYMGSTDIKVWRGSSSVKLKKG